MDKSVTNNSGRKGKKVTAEEFTKNGDGNGHKQTMTRSDIKWTVRYEDGTENVKRKKSGKNKKGSDVVPETVASFQEGGLLMNMAVTNEEYQAFEEMECSLDHAGTSNGHEISKDSEDEGSLMEESCNNNATRTDLQAGMSVPLETTMSANGLGQGHAPRNESRAAVMVTMKQQQTCQDSEEKKFMKRFALFMEQQGFINKKQDVSLVEVTKQWQPVKRWLDMSEGGCLTSVDNQDSQSVSTIYKPAVAIKVNREGHDLNRTTCNPLSSSDEFNNMSDESINAEQLTSQIGLVEIVGDSEVQPRPGTSGETNKQRSQEQQ